MNDLNSKLLAIQQQWKETLYNNVLKNNEGQISCPFSCGASDELLKSDKKVMIIGQNALGLGCQYVKYDLPQMQEWSISYLERQLKIRDNGDKWNRSPFWRFLRAFKSVGYFPCWNNLEKVVRYKVGETKEYPVDDNEREILNQKIADGKTLLQKEVELVRPDIVIFAVGPKEPFYSAVKQVLGLDVKHMGCQYPTKDKLCVDLTDIAKLGMPTFWTYHPQFLSHHKCMDIVINEIIHVVSTTN